MQQEEFANETLTEDVFAPGSKFYTRAPNYEDSLFVKEKLINFDAYFEKSKAAGSLPLIVDFIFFN